jgi:hypothetical protein
MRGVGYSKESPILPWPINHVSDSDGGKTPLRSGKTVLSIPSLLISGEIDPGCPPGNGEYIQRYLPNSLHIIEPKCGHGSPLWENCLDNLVYRLIAQGSLVGISADLECISGNTRPAFVPWRSPVRLQELPSLLRRSKGKRWDEGNRLRPGR